MKRKLLLCCLFVSLLSGLSSCSAENINGTLNSAAEKAGIDMEINITQEQLDEVTDKGKEAVDRVKEVVTDEEVQDAAKNFINSLADAISESSSANE